MEIGGQLHALAALSSRKNTGTHSYVLVCLRFIVPSSENIVFSAHYIFGSLAKFWTDFSFGIERSTGCINR
jgi:hypothetical protein